MAVDRAAVVKKADEFASQGRLDLAIAQYQALVEEQPGDLSAANALGDLYARAGDMAKAIDQFTRLAESERAQGFTSKAVALYKKALKVDPGCEEALSQLAEIAVGQQLLADATLYWNRLVQHRRERNDAPGVADALMRLAGLPVARADTKLAAARAAEPHVGAEQAAQLYAAAAAGLAREGRAGDAMEAWLEAARRTEDAAVRQAAARACVEGGRLDRAEAFLTLAVAGDEPALLWAVGERAADAGDEAVATRALSRYRSLVPDDAERASALLAKWEEATVDEPLVEEHVSAGSAWHAPDESGDVDLASMLLEAPADAPLPAYEQVVERAETPAAAFVVEHFAQPEASEVAEEPVIPIEPSALEERFAEQWRAAEPPAAVEAARETEPAITHTADTWEDAIDLSDVMELDEIVAEPVEAAAVEPPVAESSSPPAALAEPPVEHTSSTPEPSPSEAFEPDTADADLDADEAAIVAELQAAADTPALQFQAAAQLGRWFLQKGQLNRGVEWLERACAVPSPGREQGLAVRYDLADALERAGHHDRALACWSDLEFDAESFRDVPERLARLTRSLGSTR